MKTKNLLRKAFLLLALMGGVNSAWGAVTDLEFTATKTVTAGGEIWWTTAENVATANTAGWCTKNTNSSTNKYGNITPSLSGDVTDTGSPGYHAISGVQVKGGNTPADFTTSKKALVFKVTNTTAITVYGATTGDPARLQWSIYKASDNSAVVSSANSGSYIAANSSSTITKDGLSASETYIVFIEGGYKSGGNQDVVIYAIKFAAPNAGAPTINTQPQSANYESGDVISALTVAATPSSGELSYQWYSCDDTEKTNPQEVGTNSASYTPSGAGYYYCNVTDESGSTASNVATITVVDVFTPTISYSAPAVTITYTGSGTVYYTTDGSVPSSSNGTVYSAPFNLSNSCTVRAVAKKGENYSDLVKYNCYVDLSSAANFLISTGSHSGTNSSSVWTSNDGDFTLSKPEGDFNWSNNIFPGMHGHKMDNGIVYTLQPSADIKITSIKIVGRTWLNGTAATVAVSNSTPSSDTWLAGETGNVSYILTKEFTITADYGEAVTVTPTGNQFGCFLEVYGVKRSGPAGAEAVPGTTITWDFSSSATQTAAGTIDASSSNTLKATDNTTTITYVAGSNDAFEASGKGYYLKPGGKSGTSSSKLTDRYFLLNISKSGQLSLTSNSNKPGEYLIYQGSTTNPSEATAQSSITTSAGNLTKTGNIDIANGAYLFIGIGSQIYTESLSWTPETDDIALTTTDNMDGWRAFYDASNSYTVDGNTTVYIATAKGASTVTLSPISDIPAGTPVILKTSSSADSHKMTLTKAAATSSTAGNLLSVSTAGQDLSAAGIYRLGYGAEGVGFYPWSTASAAAGIVYIDAAAGARSMKLVFDDEASAIQTVAAGQKPSEIYDLQGRRVAQPTKGLYIVNGRKVVMK